VQTIAVNQTKACASDSWP